MAAWWWKAELFETCNCAPFACPCNYTAIPTHGRCESVVVYHIQEGAFGDTRLDGLSLGMIYAWPNPVHEGNGRALVYIDERANAAQREALATIGKGEAGAGGPFAIFATTYAAPAAVAVGPIEIERDGKQVRFTLGGVGRAELRPFRSAFDGSEADVHWMLPAGFIWKDGQVVNAEVGQADADGLAFRYENAWAVIADVAYNI
jgi:hypothetical protein